MYPRLLSIVALFAFAVLSFLGVASGGAWANDNFTARIALTGASGSTTGNNNTGWSGTGGRATGETGEPTTYTAAGELNTLWYTWTAPGNGVVTFETCSNTVTTFDTTLQSFTGTAVNALTGPLATNDDTAGCATTGSTGLGSRISWNVTSGTAYQIQVDGYNSLRGAFRLAWSFTGFTVTKTASAATIAAPGTITYTISVANTGAATLNGLSITDALLLDAASRTLTSGPTLTSGDSNSDGQIQTTETFVYTATYAVPQSDIDLGGTYSNTATFDTAQTNPATSSAATTAITQSPAFTNVKAQSGGSNPVTAAGQTISYTITIDNTGNVTLTAPTLVSDTFQLGGAARTLTSGPTYSSGDTDSDGAIDTTEVWVYAASYTVTQADLDATGSFTNLNQFDTAQTAPVTSNIVTTPVTRTASFTNVKAQSGGSNPVTLAGQSITYSITIANSGNQTLTAPTVVSDTFQLGGSARTLTSAPAYSSGDADSDGAIDVGETWVYAASYTVTQADLDATGDFTNLLQFDTAQTAPQNSNTVTTPVTRTPSFTNVKAQSGGSNPVTAAGQTISYSITIDNTGNQTLTAPTVVSDTFQLGGSARTLTSGPTYSSGDTDSDGAIDTSEIWVYAASYTVTQADLDATGSFTNLLQFDTAQTAPLNSNTVTTPVTRSPSFTNVKSQFAGPSPITTAGQTITYRLTIANSGNQTLTTPTVVSDTFQLGGSARTLTSGPSYTSGDTDSDGAIDVGETWIYTATYTVPQSDIDGTGSFTNLAQFDTAQTAPVTSNTVTTNVTRTASFTNVKAQSSGPSPITAAGQAIGYSITIANTGNQTLNGLSISDTFQLGGSARTLTSGPSYSSGDTDSDGQIDVGETWVYAASYTVPQSDIDGTGSFTNSATFDTTQTSPLTSNTVTTNVTRTASFTNVKSQFAGPNPVTAAGQTITYRVTIANTGNQTLTTPTVVSDTFQLGGSARTLTSGPSYTSGDTDSDGNIDVGETWIYTATYTVPQSDIDGTGSFTNLAQFDTAQTAPLNSNTVTATVTRSPSFTVVKAQSSGPSPVTLAGQVIGYSITVANTGNQTLNGLSITDTFQLGGSARTLTSGPSYSSGDTDSDGQIDVGETWVYAASYTVPQTDMDGTGSFTNNATFDTTQTAASTSNTVTTNVTRTASFSILKGQSGGPNPVTAQGQTISYLITINNTGNQTLTGLSLTDSLLQAGSPRTLTSGPTYSSGDSNSDGEVDVGEIWLYNAAYTVTLSDMNNGGTFANTATFDTAQTSPSTSAAVTTPVTQTPLLSIDKTFVITTDYNSDGLADPGDIITYYYDVTNTGNVTITNVSVADVHGGSGAPPVPSPASVASLAPAATTQFTATYQVTQIDVDNQ